MAKYLLGLTFVAAVLCGCSGGADETPKTQTPPSNIKAESAPGAGGAANAAAAPGAPAASAGTLPPPPMPGGK